jgi:GntR family transcriptional regulator, arabinose operon transcriptional repressor
LTRKMPKYEEIAQHLINQIQDGALPPGTKLPTDAELTVQYGVSRQTILNALGQLKAKGLVTRAPKTGTFVREHSTPSRHILLLEFGMQEEMSANPIDLALIRRVEQALEGKDCALSLKMINALPAEPLSVDRLQASIGDFWNGILLLCHWPAEGLVEFLSGLHVPVVSLVQEYRADNISSIVADNREGAALAVQYLLALGHRRIGFATWPEKYWGEESRRRLDGYQDALREFGLVADPDLITTPELESGDLPEKLKKLLALRRRPTAILCVNDRLALVTLSVLTNELGVAVPKDMSLIGFGGFRSVAGVVSPALTTVYVPWLELASRGADVLLARISGDGNQPGLVTLHTELIKRDSCGPGPCWPGNYNT